MFPMATSGFSHVRYHIILLTFVVVVHCWDTSDFELFDLVEEVNANFYEVLGVSQNAPTSEIRKSYRELSRQLHPDKNKAEDAEVKFRQLVAVYETLKDENKRQQYDLVLQNGLPDWRQPIYYYRRARKMGLMEFTILLGLILTVGQYIVAWSIYLERKFTLEENFAAIRKKNEKKSKKKQDSNEDIDDVLQEEISAIPKPQLKDLLPILIIKLIVRSFICLPQTVSDLREFLKTRKKEKEEEEISDDDVDDEDTKRKPKKRTKIELPEYSATDAADNTAAMYNEIPAKQNEEIQKVEKTGPWTEDDFAMLAKAFYKYPGGTSERWEKISEMVGRPVPEVISQGKKLKTTVGTSVSSGNKVKLKASATGQQISENIISRKEDFDNWESYVASDTELRKRNKKKTLEGETTSENKESGLKPKSGQPENQSDTSVKVMKVKTESKEVSGSSDGGQTAETSSSLWSQNQQVILEYCLKQYPKGTDQRWEKIAEQIPGKSKEDCLARVKYLAELVKKKKEKL